MKLIGVAGPKRSGKDTVADHVAERLEGWRKASFAGPMKRMLATGLGLTGRQLDGDLKDTVDLRYGVTPRRMLETLGTEWGREMVDRDIWLNALKTTLDTSAAGYVISDVRMPSEADFVRRHPGGLLIHLTGRGAPDDSHPTRVGLHVESRDAVVANVRGLDDLRREVDGVLADRLGWEAPPACKLHDRGDEAFCATCERTFDKMEGGIQCPRQ